MTDRLPDDVWVVVPAYNEGSRLGSVLQGLLQVAKNVVVVDDGSADDTAEAALRYPVWVLRHVVNLGQGAALQTGITFALRQGAEYVATFDADGQHEPADLPAMLAALRESGADYALGSRFLGRADGIPLGRKLMLKAAVWFTRLMSRISISDTHNGIRMMTRRGAERIRITMNRMEHASEILDQIARSGLKYVELPVTIRYTETSLAKGQRTSAAVRLGLKILAEKVLR
ncbi:MAG: glycosyltransferase family 2 protein [Thermoguttaceae bacterium]|nr:glycosyltransferase family 2 protein [Thermoguttaceae bacterium]